MTMAGGSGATTTMTGGGAPVCKECLQFSQTGKEKHEHAEVFFMGMHWARTWSLLLKGVDEETVKSSCKLLEKCVLEFFSVYHWNFGGRLEA
uniref:Uncharacterized protein n=1 Tax=Oryza barthii TaxID=65489 RepID=A0A0D3HV89_9ORYZ